MTMMKIIHNIYNTNNIHESTLRKRVCFYSYAEIEDSQQLEAQITKLSTLDIGLE